MTRSAAVLFLGLVLSTSIVRAGPCGQGEMAVTGLASSWNLLARLDQGERSGLAGGKISDSEEAAGHDAPASAQVETYMRFHAEITGGGARALLMPWPELRSLIQ